jgi:hypothetical protein
MELWQTAMQEYGIPAEVLSDDGKQFTGRFGRPRPAEVPFERICRENGITQRLTKPRSPTTTGKIEQLHQALQQEVLNAHGPCPPRPSRKGLDHWSSSDGAAPTVRDGAVPGRMPPHRAPDGPFLTSPGLLDPCARATTEQPGGAGPYRGIRATMEQPSMGIGLDQYGGGIWIMPEEAVAIVGKGIGARDDAMW